jgi:hypothetical protein
MSDSQGHRFLPCSLEIPPRGSALRLLVSRRYPNTSERRCWLTLTQRSARTHSAIKRSELALPRFLSQLAG